MSTSSKADIKRERVLKALNHEEPVEFPSPISFGFNLSRVVNPIWIPRLKGQKLPKEMGKRSSIKRLYMGSDHFVAENVPPENYEYMLRRT